MSRNNYDNFPGYQFSPRSQFMGDSLRNPYELEFRTPHGFIPPHPTEFSPRQQSSTNRRKRPYSQSSAVSPNRYPYGGNSSFQFGTSTPYDTDSSFQRSPNYSSYSMNSSFQQSPSMSPSPSQYSRNSPGFANQPASTPKIICQRHKHFFNQDSNPGGSTDMQDYYRPSIVGDPWKNLKPSKVAPPETRHHYYAGQEF